MVAPCPECNRQIEFTDIRLDRCPYCGIGICISGTYFRTGGIAAVIFTIFVIAATGGLVWTSPAVFSYVMLWMFLMFAVFMVALVVFIRIWMRISPPKFDRIHANDVITRLRLGE